MLKCRGKTGTVGLSRKQLARAQKSMVNSIELRLNKDFGAEICVQVQ